MMKTLPKSENLVVLFSGSMPKAEREEENRFLSLDKGEQRVDCMLERLGGISEEHSCQMTGMLIWPFEEEDT
jgi:hypothetical protein